MPDIFNPSPKPSVTPEGPKSVSFSQPTDPASHQFKKLSPLSAFCQFPTGITIEDLEPDEHFHLFLRAHFITNQSWITITLILFAISLILFFFFSTTSFPLSFLGLRYILSFVIFYYLTVFTYAFINFITWFYNVGLITNKRVINIDYSDLTYHNVCATKIDLVKDIEYTQAGFTRSFFDYGDVIVHTDVFTPNKESFDFKEVPKPAAVVSLIENMIGKGPND